MDNAFTAAVVTVSDKGSRGERVDRSGEAACEALRSKGVVVASRHLVPDERDGITVLLRHLCDIDRVALVLTTGGTGFSPRDVTPEATLDVVERLCPGIPEAMRALSLAVTRRAMLSRAVAGIRGRTLIVNLPGSPAAVGECLGFVMDEVLHGLAILRGTDGECGA